MQKGDRIFTILPFAEGEERPLAVDEELKDKE